MIILLLLPMQIIVFPTSVNSKNEAGSKDFREEGQSRKIYELTLITGDVVEVAVINNTKFEIIGIKPADPKKLNRGYRTWEDEDGLYVIPSDVDIRKVDVELFNVKYLIKEGYYNLTQLPIIVVTEEPKVIMQNDIEKTIKEQKYGIVGAKYKILPAISSKLNLKKIGEAFSNIISKPYVKKILLDKKVGVKLNESIPLIGADKVWEIGYNGSGIRIAIIDTGIDNSHPDFYFSNGTSKIERNIDFTDDHDIDDLFGHGTHCAGIAAGTGAASGGKFKGVAPGAKLWNVKVLNRYGWGYLSWVISGIEYATYGPDGIENTGDEADVLSLSLGAYWWSDGTDPLSMACDNAVDLGRIVVVAAGNWRGYFHIGVPATARKAITVGATDKYDNIAWFSSYGPTIDYRVKPDLLAPGVNIISARARNGLFKPIPENSYYTMLSGTSMSTPHVAGAAALLKQIMLTRYTGGRWIPDLVRHVKDALISHSEDLGYNVYQQGGGRLDIYKIIGVSSLCVHPATVSFGLYTEDRIDSVVLEVSARRAVLTRNLTLSVIVEDIINRRVINCASLNVTELQIPPGEVRYVLLAINTTVPRSIYSGKLFIKDVDGNYTIHAIFGFARLNKLEVTFLDLNGNPLANAFVGTFKANATYNEYLAELHKWMWNYTDSSGKANLYVFDGVYYVIGSDYGKDAYMNAYAINKSHIDHNVNITLDLRNAYKISYSSPVPNQIIAWFSNMISYGYYNETYGYWYTQMLGYSWYYPRITDVYISSTDLLFSTYYQHYDKSYINVPNPIVLLAPELYSICFYQKGIDQSKVISFDKSQLAKADKDYRVALTPSIAACFERDAYVSLFPYYAWHWSISWEITSPKRIIEWLVPEIDYYVRYWKYGDQPNVNTPYFRFAGWEWYPSPGSYSIATNSHPLSSDISIHVWSHDSGNTAVLYAWTDVFHDSYHPYSYDTLWSDNGRLIIKRNGTIILDTGEFYDYYWWRIDNLQLPARIELELYGRSNLYLSTNMYTKIQFDVPINGSYHVWNPFSITIKDLDLNNTHTAGNITGYLIANIALIQNPSIEYSIDDGITWITVEAKKISDNKYSFLLGNLMGVYVSLRINATDIDGANISQTIIRGFYAIPKEFEEWSLRGPRVDQLYIKIYPNITSEAIGLKNNEIDLMDWPVPPEFVNEFQSDPNIILAKYNEFGMFEFDLNHRKWPTSNLHFRRALAYLTNKDALIRDVLKGYGTRIDSPVVPSQGSWQNPNIIIYNYDPNKAAEELELGGFIDTDGDGIRNDPISGTNMAPIDIIVREDHIPRRIAGTWLAEELEKLGVPVNLQILPRR